MIVGAISRISGPVVLSEGMMGSRMYDVVKVGDRAEWGDHSAGRGSGGHPGVRGYLWTEGGRESIKYRNATFRGTRSRAPLFYL